MQTLEIEKPKRIGLFITTISGKEIYPLDAHKDEIALYDVAHGLSRICRFNGHVEDHYSVGYHTLFCVEVVKHLGGNELEQLWALHHDDSEAYICDIPKPIKPFLRGYKKHEKKLQNTILEALNIPTYNKRQYHIVEQADVTMLHNEVIKLTKYHRAWADHSLCLDFVDFKPVTMNEVRDRFLEKHHELYSACKLKGLI